MFFPRDKLLLLNKRFSSVIFARNSLLLNVVTMGLCEILQKLSGMSRVNTITFISRVSMENRVGRTMFYFDRLLVSNCIRKCTRAICDLICFVTVKLLQKEITETGSIVKRAWNFPKLPHYLNQIK